MINTKALHELFKQNTDEKLCKQWWLMTPNGTLLAHSNEPGSDTRHLRSQVAVVTLAWQENDTAHIDDATSTAASTFSTTTNHQLQDNLRALTIEADTNNIIATRVQPQLILVLEGGVPPRRPGFEVKTTPEGPNDEQYPGDEHSTGGSRDGTASSRASSIVSVSGSNVVLKLQRRKLEAMANALADDFEQTGFVMPTDGPYKYF